MSVSFEREALFVGRWLVRSGRKVLFYRIEVGCLLFRHPFHHLVPYPYLTNQRGARSKNDVGESHNLILVKNREK